MSNIKERFIGAIGIIVSILAVIGLKSIIREISTDLQLRQYRKNGKGDIFSDSYSPSNSIFSDAINNGKKDIFSDAVNNGKEDIFSDNYNSSNNIFSDAVDPFDDNGLI